MQYVVIGAGPAGVSACETLRRRDPRADIILLGDEPEPPYGRMAIPYLLADNISEQGTLLRKTPDHYKQLGIQLRTGRVTRLDPDADRLHLQGGEALSFDRLLIATGASPVRPPVPGLDLPGVSSCWTLADARAIAERAVPGSRVLLMGAGFIGSIILESLLSRGVSLTLVEPEDRMVPRMLDDIAGALLKRWCEARGVRVLTNHAVVAVDEAEGSLMVALNSGEDLAVDLVITATGVRANSGFLKDSGVDCDDGVQVNDFMQSSRTGVYAAGDVAQGRDFSTRRFQAQAIQPTAVEHARIAALNMISEDSVPHAGSLNMNILDTLGLISTSFGRWRGMEEGDEAILVDGERYLYINLQFEDDRLVGASSLGHSENMGVVRGLIRGRIRLGGWKDRLISDPTRLMEAYLASAQS